MSKAKEEDGDEFGEEKANAEATQSGEGDDADDDDATNNNTHNSTTRSIFGAFDVNQLTGSKPWWS